MKMLISFSPSHLFFLLWADKRASFSKCVSFVSAECYGCGACCSNASLLLPPPSLPASLHSLQYCSSVSDGATLRYRGNLQSVDSTLSLVWDSSSSSSSCFFGSRFFTMARFIPAFEHHRPHACVCFGYEGVYVCVRP